MSDPSILEDFYKFIFAKKRGSMDTVTDQSYEYNPALDKIAIAKGVDAKFNTKMLLNYKAEFDKRIYDIKANRV